MQAVTLPFSGRIIRTFLLLTLLLASNHLFAGTLVRVSTTMGDYTIELLDDVAPVTVQNFLNYVQRNDFNGTYLHRVINDFVVQGGAFRFQLFVGPVDVPADPPIVNEFSVSNTRGTVAMAKLDGNPNSASNQWFVNLTDNLELDTSNGGFTVFGNVVGNGMTVLEAIGDLPFVNLGVKASDTPYWTTEFSNGLDFIYMNVEVVDRFSEAPHVFETNRGLLITSVSVNNGEETVSLNFNSVPGEGDLVLRANLESIIPRRDSFEGIATYSTTDNRLRIPVLEVNQNGSVFLIRNVVFALTDAEQSLFTIESYEQ